MSDVLTKFGKRQDAVKAIYTDVPGAETLAPVRPGDINLVGNVLIDLHHRCELMGTTLTEQLEAVRDLAEWEWSLIEGPLREKMAAAQQAAAQ